MVDVNAFVLMEHRRAMYLGISIITQRRGTRLAYTILYDRHARAHGIG